MWLPFVLLRVLSPTTAQTQVERAKQCVQWDNHGGTFVRQNSVPYHRQYWWTMDQGPTHRHMSRVEKWSTDRNKWKKRVYGATHVFGVRMDNQTVVSVETLFIPENFTFTVSLCRGDGYPNELSSAQIAPKVTSVITTFRPHFCCILIPPGKPLLARIQTDCFSKCHAFLPFARLVITHTKTSRTIQAKNVNCILYDHKF